MPVSFYLASRENKKGESPIYVSIRVHGIRYCSNLGFCVKPANWQVLNSGCKVKKNTVNSSGVPASVINAKISTVTAVFLPMEDKYDPEEITKEFLKKQFNTVVDRVDKNAQMNGELISSHMQEFLNEGRNYYHWSHATIMKMNTFRNHLERFNPRATFGGFNEKGLNKYLLFCSEVVGMIDTSVAREFKLVKWFLNWALEKGYHENKDFQKFKPKLKETKRPVIFLTKEELMKLYNYKIPASGQKVKVKDMYGNTSFRKIEDRLSMDKSRDLFCFCCFTSLRFSDMANLKRTDIVNGKIRIVTQKTDDVVEIELNPFAKAILDKYSSFDFNGLALPVISNQKLNQYIKNICELCEFNEPITITQYCNGRREESTFPKWMVISSHAARRTFICTALSAGIPPHIVMKWTGHSDYETMKPYIDVAENIKKKAMDQFTSAFE